MPRPALDCTGPTRRTALMLDARALPYLAKVAANTSQAVRRCISDHAQVADVLRNPDTTDAEKLAALYQLMPHAAEALEKRRAARAIQPTTASNEEPTDGQDPA